MMEILAPCGGPEHLAAAVYCGADAVYLGGKQFSARRNAANFDDFSLGEAVEFCHLYGVKVYLTVNTMVRDDELPAVSDIIETALDAGVDALIVADVGVARLVRSITPDMPLHASTQMSIHDLSGVEFARTLGFSRVVLARELSRSQIERIAKNTDMELEVFVHGALCGSVSGQCYMSAMIGSRSGNRGLCAQPCRLDFSTGKTSNALSLKDLSLVQHLKDFPNVAALKIEGRMKRPEYVAAAVTACRHALGGDEVDIDGLRSVFSRSGFTDAYFTGVRSDMRGIRTKEDVTAASDVLEQLAKLYSHQKICYDILIDFWAKSGHPVTAHARCGEYTAEITGEIPEAAVTRELTCEAVKTQLAKLGGTPFRLNAFSADIDPGLSAPISAINKLRRDIVDRIQRAIIGGNSPKYTRAEAAIPAESAENVRIRDYSNSPPLIRCELQDIAQLEAVYDEVSLVSLPMRCFDDGALSKYADKLIISPSRLVSEDIYDRLRGFKARGFKRLLCQNLSHIRIGSELGFTLHGGAFLNVGNSLAVGALAEAGLSDCIVSPELRLSEKPRGRIPLGVIAYGRLPVMLLARCPVHDRELTRDCGQCSRYLTDRTKRRFRLRCDGDCLEVLNSDTIWMADKLQSLNSYDFVTLLFDDHSPEVVSETVRAYKHGGQPPRPYTRGLLFRGVE